MREARWQIPDGFGKTLVKDRPMKHALIALSFLLLPSAALPCSICGGDFQNKQTLRQEVATAKVVVVGTLSNAQLDPATGEGRTDLKVEQVIKGSDLLNGDTLLRIPKYYPGDGKAPPRGVFLFEVRAGRLSLLGGHTTRGVHLAEYAAAAARLDAAQALPFYMRHLDHPDADVAADAFVELARAADADLARAAKSVAPERLRRLLTDAQFPRERVGLVAFLLACAGNAKDADLMLAMFKQVPEDRPSMRRGLMIGYTALRPREGWEMTLSLLGDAKRGFLERNAALGVLIFFHNWKPDENRSQILRGMRCAVESGELADMAVEELRRWGWWDLTDTILTQFNRRSHEAVIVRSAIVRYALTCPQPAAKRFIDELRKRDPDMVAAGAEALEADKPK
jgi:hypothetical protein